MGGEFVLSVTPGPEDVDTYVKILSSSNLQASDSTTGARVSAEADQLTTELPSDETAAGRGIVSDT